MNDCFRSTSPYAQNFTTDIFSQYRQTRLKEGITPNGVNREHAYLKSAFNELIRLGEWTKENPVAKIRLLKIDEPELSYLTNEEIEELSTAIKSSNSNDLYPVFCICLATGARWSEAINLKKTISKIA